MTRQKKEAVIRELFKTLSYSDIFNYPLTGDQLFSFLGIQVNKKELLYGLKMIPHVIVRNTIYYFLPHRIAVVAERIRKEKISIEKLRQTKLHIKILGLFPTIQFIGISGSLALKNADKKDDCDVFFITSPNTVWLTRLIVYLYLHLIGKKRSLHETAKAICANMFIDTSHMKLNKKNVYIAHEVIQLLPVVNKNNVYEKFLQTNKWIKSYFPNYVLPKVKKNKTIDLLSLLLPMEFFSMKIQKWYMQKKQTRETTTATLIAFHPIDYEGETIKLYERKIKRYAV